ncbi:MAG TPA: divalent metal cation transporter [Bacteroidetes bacterium]|nr:divalent metal cation transporter [Bacteroidota bacterium]
MAKTISLRKRAVSLLLWSIVPAAFIGPGTVATCSKAGASFGLALLWALLFSILATLVLQEAAARITLASGKSLGGIISIKYAGAKSKWIKRLLFGAVAFGCAAYQAGNILGAVSGLLLLSDLPQAVLVGALGLVAAALLWTGSIKTIARFLALVVFFMGLVFMAVALRSPVSIGEMMAGAFVPSIPGGSELLVIGLVGTTVVPYNLFLASGLSKGQGMAEMRWGLGLAVLVGGVVSVAILSVGLQVEGEFSFAALAGALTNGLGAWAKALFGFGLFAAGASSSVTAPLAAAITGQTIFGGNDEKWSANSKNFRLVWGIVLGIGLLFGLLGLKPIPAIITAQAINGLLLPIVAIFLLIAVNDKNILPKKYVNRMGWNLLMGAVVLVVAALGVYNLWRVLFLNG